MDAKNGETKTDKVSNRFRSNITLRTGEHESTEERKIELRGIPTGRHQTSGIILDRTPIQTTKWQRERGGHPTRTHNPAHKRQQTSQRGIHHNLPSCRGRCNDPQTRGGDNSNNCTAHSTRVQNQRGKVMDRTSGQTNNNRTSTSCIWLTISRTDNKIPPWCGRIHNWRHMDQGNQSGKLQHMAHIHTSDSPTPLPRIQWNTKGTHEETAPGSTINKGARRDRVKLTCHPKSQRCLHQSLQCNRNDAQQPDRRKIPCNIQQRKPIHDGPSGSWQKLYCCRTDEEQVRRSNDKGIHSFMDKTHCTRNRQTKDTYPRQWSISRIQKGNPEELQHPTSAAG